MSSLEASESPQVNLVHEWGRGFEKQDLDHIAKLLHKDYRHISLPRSINRPEENREQWLQHIGAVIGLWTESGVSYIGFPFHHPRLNPSTQWTIHSITEAPGKVVVHVSINPNPIR